MTTPYTEQSDEFDSSASHQPQRKQVKKKPGYTPMPPAPHAVPARPYFVECVRLTEGRGKVLELTEELADDQPVEIDNGEARKLVDGWQRTIEAFIKEVQGSADFGRPETLALYLTVHHDLDHLYTRLGRSLR